MRAMRRRQYVAMAMRSTKSSSTPPSGFRVGVVALGEVQEVGGVIAREDGGFAREPMDGAVAAGAGFGFRRARGFGFGRQVVDMGSIEGDLTEPGAEGVDVHPGLQEG